MGALLLQLGPTIPGEVEEGPDLGTIVAPVIAPRDMPTILLFVAPTCGLCKPIVEALPTLRRHYRDVRITPVVIGEDPVRREIYAAKIEGARTDLDHLYND